MRILILIFIFYAVNAPAQIVLDHFVVAPFCVNAGDNSSMTATVGQIETTTLAGTNHLITQGFQQPNGYIPLFPQFEITKNLCNQRYDVKITSVTACEANDSLSFYWNGINGDSSAFNLPEITEIDISSNYGCIYHAVLNFSEMAFIEQACELEFYNYISPNGDGDNDFWTITNIGAEKFRNNEVTIYNRWGSEIFHTTNYDNTSRVWSGLSKENNALPDGTYFYVVQAAGVEFNGYIELQR
jgi:gliding motility-associated-like protein